MDTPARPHPAHRPVRSFRRLLAAVAIIAVAVTLVTGTSAFESEKARASASSSSFAEQQHQGALDGFKDRRLQAIGAIAVAESVVASARLALDASAGKVLGEASRVALREQVELEDARIASAEAEIELGNRLTDPGLRPGGHFMGRSGLREQAAAIGAYRFAAASGLSVGRENLAAPVTAVHDAVAAWTAEQKRIAAEKAARLAAEQAAARAAAAAARQAAAQQQAGRSSVQSGAGRPPARGATRAATPYKARTYNKYVWTSGWQAQIDACRGAVDISAHYGVAVIAEHWRCGGASFPGAGSLITLSGVRSGTYRVGSVVAVLNIATDGASDVPRGYGLLYQTCINGSSATMSFTVLTRIG